MLGRFGKLHYVTVAGNFEMKDTFVRTVATTTRNNFHCHAEIHGSACAVNAICDNEYFNYCSIDNASGHLPMHVTMHSSTHTLQIIYIYLLALLRLALVLVDDGYPGQVRGLILARHGGAESRSASERSGPAQAQPQDKPALTDGRIRLETSVSLVSKRQGGGERERESARWRWGEYR